MEKFYSTLFEANYKKFSLKSKYFEIRNGKNWKQKHFILNLRITC